ncbi:acyltransferase family protein [Negativibacillus massiliensis]|uniref:acyltransferase family protein n=1 Tax=Negativibacillus massiliensis TaxID=1871035 RepID=UPI003AF27943
MSKRIEWVDIGKYICIMFVMLSHLESGTDLLKTFYSPFFLTMFFFLAGYVYRQPKSFKEHIVKKLKGLFVPWIIFSNVNILLSAVISLKSDRNPLKEIAWNFLQIRGLGDGIWFVAALFVTFIPFYFVIKWNKTVNAILLSACLSLISVLYTKLMKPELLPWGTVALPWHIEYIFQAMLWMVLGYYFKQYAERVFDGLNYTTNRVTLWTFYLIIAFLPIEGFWISIPLTYFRSVLGICAVTAICKRVKSNVYVRFVGANTLTYFALHGKLYAVIEAVLGMSSIYERLLENVFTSSIVAIGITTVMSVVLMVPAMIINRWFPWVLGRKR